MDYSVSGQSVGVLFTSHADNMIRTSPITNACNAMMATTTSTLIRETIP
jgi:hypothetical protein